MAYDAIVVTVMTGRRGRKVFSLFEMKTLAISLGPGEGAQFGA